MDCLFLLLYFGILDVRVLDFYRKRLPWIRCSIDELSRYFFSRFGGELAYHVDTQVNVDLRTLILLAVEVQSHFMQLASDRVAEVPQVNFEVADGLPRVFEDQIEDTFF